MLNLEVRTWDQIRVISVLESALNLLYDALEDLLPCIPCSFFFALNLVLWALEGWLCEKQIELVLGRSLSIKLIHSAFHTIFPELIKHNTSVLSNGPVPWTSSWCLNKVADTVKFSSQSRTWHLKGLCHPCVCAWTLMIHIKHYGS